MQKDRKIYHLSHIDLDGYSCQLILKYTPYKVENFNANYGAEVKENLEVILEKIKNSDEKAYILITDLNLTTDESKWLNSEVNRLNELKKDVVLQLLDHHGSGIDSSNKYDWYFLDTTRCATKITYDFVKENFEFNEPNWLEKFVSVVNAVDLWKQDEVENFEFGKVCMRLVNETKELYYSLQISDY